MDRILNEILIELDSFSQKTQREQRKLLRRLEERALLLGSSFEDTVRKIEPTEETVLFEIYEALSLNPERWIKFIISEFNRVKGIAENADLKKQNSIVEPLQVLSFFARKEFNGLNKLIHECSLSLKSPSIPVVKICMDLLMDSYLIDTNKYESCKRIIEKQINSGNKEISEFAELVLRDNKATPIQQKLSKLVSKYYWIIFPLIVLLIVGIDDGFKAGLVSVLLLTSGLLLGFVTFKIISILLKRERFITNIKLFAIFLILTGALYLLVDNKTILIFMIPLSIPTIIHGLIALIRN